ncbi:MAG: peptidase M16 [Gammaproteobacteria bacterium]|nr:MAG: peptidase M16 [Gammaproteobacteria bacterium]RLA61814.1 MAG: peptidase M16 [Gammaproteobacteria bacterium]
MSNSSNALPNAHHAFQPIHQETIESLNIRVEQFEHKATGAVHYHLASQNTENVFLVALRTVPKDSTGVAHILEHTALCGSEHYPVRDPFFMMLRRSLNTFMNAFTSSDWTAYPFASQNRKDFNNLLDVYLDAVFFSRLDPLDFAQEGHRVEFAEPDNPDSELVFKGVVFNEMKGAMSSVSSTLWSKLCEQLFPSTTYHYNSGGDPEHIPDLSYEQLQAFYRSHYHPSNAIFMTFGDIEASAHQAVFEEKALAHFDKLEQRIAMQAERRLQASLRVQDSYAFDENGSTDNKTHLVMGWMLGESADLEKLLDAQLLSSVLLDNSASPLQHALETTELGQAPSPLCGLEDSMREMVFCCGIEGSEAEHADALERMVLDVLQQVAEQGVSQERLEAVLHQLELHQREISGDSYPYGLQLILQALGSATHYSDPIAVLNLEPVIAGMREKIRDPDYIRRLAQKLLLDNPHRVTLIMTPDTALSNKRMAAEAARLAAIKADMDEKQRAAVMQLAADLVKRQGQVDDESILPKVELSDVPASLPDLSFAQSDASGIHTTFYGQGTNGIVYQQAIAPLPLLSDEQLQVLPLYTNILTELGLGDDSYLEAQHRQAATVGAISAFSSMRGHIENEQEITANFVLSSKALLRNAEAQAQLMHDTLHTVRFDETDRIRDLIAQQRARRDQAITGNGHGLAMTAACAGMSPLAQLNHQLSGLAGIGSLRALDDRLRDPRELDAFAAQLGELHSRLKSTPMQFLAIAEDHKLEEVVQGATTIWSADNPGSLATPFELQPIRERRGEIWLTNTQVNFCARAYPTVPVQHPDAAALTVLGGVLRNGFLHRAIREQGGAYGGGASQDSGVAAFRFFSYRDPRLAETLQDFDAAVSWMLETPHEYRVLEEAILGVIGSMDKPSSPAGEAKQHFHNRLFGRSHDQRELFRQQILAVSLDDLRRVTQTYLQPKLASTAVVTNSSQLESTASLREELDLAVYEL